MVHTVIESMQSNRGASQSLTARPACTTVGVLTLPPLPETIHSMHSKTLAHFMIWKITSAYMPRGKCG